MTNNKEWTDIHTVIAIEKDKDLYDMEARNLFKALNGIFCVYKPAGLTMNLLSHTIKVNLARDLNALPWFEKQRVLFHPENLNTDKPVATAVPDLRHDPLVLGDRFLQEDFIVNYTDRLAMNSSGVVVVGLGKVGVKLLKKVNQAKYIRAYHIKGELGKASSDYTKTGRLLEKSTYDHVTQHKLDKVLTGIQAGHQKNMFNSTGLDLQSQEAYELAVKGLMRPVDKESGPVLYGLKCIDFYKPNFTLEVHAINEDCDYLAWLIHEIGLVCRTTAIATQIHRIRYGHYNLDHTLLRKHWTARNITDSINHMWKDFRGDKYLQHTLEIEAAPATEVEYLTDGHSVWDSALRTR